MINFAEHTVLATSFEHNYIIIQYVAPVARFINPLRLKYII